MTAKRMLDVVLSAVLLAALSPLVVLTALIVWVSLGRPVLFRQQRPGIHGRLFTMYKFRTMRSAHSREGHALPDHLRLNRFGRFLRASSLDELPELFNVFGKGDMQPRRPRPLLVEYLPLYTPRKARRHEVLPGITGWAQINGRNSISWEAKFALDIWYVDNQSLLLDMKILALMCVRVLARTGTLSVDMRRCRLSPGREVSSTAPWAAVQIMHTTDPTQTPPPWAELIEADDDCWSWRNGRLQHVEAIAEPYAAPSSGSARKALVDFLYATTMSRRFRAALAGVLGELGATDWALNLGAGRTRIHPRAINIDLYEADGIDIVTRGHGLPFRSDVLSLVLSQEVLEHLERPADTISEIHRVLRPGGKFYCQVLPSSSAITPAPTTTGASPARAFKRYSIRKSGRSRSSEFPSDMAPVFIALPSSSSRSRPVRSTVRSICRPRRWLRCC